MKKQRRSFMTDFREFFFRGLAIILPTILTIWILVAVYKFVDVNIAGPINSGVKQLILNFTDIAQPEVGDIETAKKNLTNAQQAAWRNTGMNDQWLIPYAREYALERKWDSFRLGNWVLTNLFGLVVAIILIYSLGMLLGSFLGKRLYRKGESMFMRLPVIKMVYPSVKQVTDFLVGGGDDDDEKIQFSKVVAVQYPRKGLWSIGLVTGDTLKAINEHAGETCITIFVPSSPTPFTGYVITVPKSDTIDLPITVDQALRFTVSGGVIVPEGQRVAPVKSKEKDGVEAGSITGIDEAKLETDVSDKSTQK